MQKNKQPFSLKDFEQGLMLAGYISPINATEVNERERLCEFEQKNRKKENLFKMEKIKLKLDAIQITVWRFCFLVWVDNQVYCEMMPVEYELMIELVNKKRQYLSEIPKKMSLTLKRSEALAMYRLLGVTRIPQEYKIECVIRDALLDTLQRKLFHPSKPITPHGTQHWDYRLSES